MDFTGGTLITGDGKRYEFTPLSPEDFLKAFEPYGKELGYLVFAWNRLHECLCHLFAVIVKSDAKGLAEAVWHSTDSDAGQRNMLRAAVGKADHLSDEQRESILWILNEIDQWLRNSRNEALHAPLEFIRGIKDDNLTLWLEASVWSASARAKALRRKDLITEFKHCSETAVSLHDYAAKIGRALTDQRNEPWPQKPSLPRAGQKTTHKESSRQKPAK